MNLELTEKLVTALETCIPIDAWGLSAKNIGFTSLKSRNEGFTHELRLNDGDANWNLSIDNLKFTTTSLDFQNRLNTLAEKTMKFAWQRIGANIEDLGKKLDKLK